jgi:hypothetical protein
MLLIGCYEGTSLFSRLIKWETRSSISHVSILQVPDCVFDEDRLAIRYNVLHAAMDVCPVWEAWGSLNPSTCRVFKRSDIHEGHTPGTHIRLMRLKPMHARMIDEDKVVAFLDAQVGKKYDWLGIIRFALRIDRNRADEWFCSELVYEAMERGGVSLLHNVDSYWVSPGDVHRSPKLTELIHVRTNPKAAKQELAI